MHAAHPDRSPRLRRVLALLRDGCAHSTRDIVAGADVVAVNSCIAELRQWGAEIETIREPGARGTVYRYRLVSEPGRPLAASAQTQIPT